MVRYRTRFMFRGATSNSIMKSGTLRYALFEVPGFWNSV